MKGMLDISTYEETELLESLDFKPRCEAPLDERLEERCPEEARWGGWCTACLKLSIMLCDAHAEHVRQNPEEPCEHMKPVGCGTKGKLGTQLKLKPL
jgi:hypothetical protein